jgi:hypothetical protein
MKRLSLLILPLLASGCVTASPVAVCDGTVEARDALADALLVDGGNQSVVAGARLLSVMDAACATR